MARLLTSAMPRWPSMTSESTIRVPTGRWKLKDSSADCGCAPPRSHACVEDHGEHRIVVARDIVGDRGSDRFAAAAGQVFARIGGERGVDGPVAGLGIGDGDMGVAAGEGQHLLGHRQPGRRDAGRRQQKQGQQGRNETRAHDISPERGRHIGNRSVLRLQGRTRQSVFFFRAATAPILVPGEDHKKVMTASWH